MLCLNFRGHDGRLTDVGDFTADDLTEDVLEVIDQVNREMTWFGERMWMRACREIQKSYTEWGDPLTRMARLHDRLQVRHVYSQPLAADYRMFQEDFGRQNPWFEAVHIPGQTHFPTLENPAAVAEAVRSFYV